MMYSWRTTLPIILKTDPPIREDTVTTEMQNAENECISPVHFMNDITELKWHDLLVFVQKSILFQISKPPCSPGANVTSFTVSQETAVLKNKWEEDNERKGPESCPLICLFLILKCCGWLWSLWTGKWASQTRAAGSSLSFILSSVTLCLFHRLFSQWTGFIGALISLHTLYLQFHWGGSIMNRPAWRHQ